MDITYKAELINKINEGLERIRPYLQADGGDIEFVELSEQMEVTVSFLGSCVECPMNVQTLKAGVEQSIKRSVPEIQKVIMV